MKISFLLPSKNRLDLLKSALESIRSQDGITFEVIVSDNASGEPYEEYIRGLNDPRLVYFRHDTPVPVTTNWSKALSLSTGDYVHMLGDDDALAPAFAEQVAPFVTADGPDIVYLAAYHYGYPNVFAPGHGGYMARLWWEFVEHDDGPTCLVPSFARELARSVLEFRHRMGYNAQHFLMKRSFIESFDAIGGLYQSPYPDFFSAAISFLRAREIVVVPTESVIIGISPKSFGAYYVSQREHEGFDFLDNRAIDRETQAFVKEHALPGDMNNTNWLISNEISRKAVGDEFGTRNDIDRYYAIQIAALLRQRVVMGQRDDAALDEVLGRLTRREAMIVGMLRVALEQTSGEEAVKAFTAVGRELGQYPPSGYSGLVDIGPHADITDAIRFLRGVQDGASSAEEPVGMEVAHGEPGAADPAEVTPTVGAEVEVDLPPGDAEEARSAGHADATGPGSVTRQKAPVPPRSFSSVGRTIMGRWRQRS